MNANDDTTTIDTALLVFFLSGLKPLHVTYYSWHDLPMSLWIINECLKYMFIPKPIRHIFYK
jgi:hypothetical protein